MKHFANHENLVSTQWAADHLDDPAIRFIEAGWDASEYESGHVPGAVAGWGFSDIERPDTQNLPDKAQLEAMLSKIGIANNQTVILYGGLSNLVAAMAFWLLKIFGHADVRLLDGGRQKWIIEGRTLTKEIPFFQPTQYIASQPDWRLRASKEDIQSWLGNLDVQIVDARPVDMYTGENLSGIARSGHIPGAINLPSERIVDEGGNFLAWQHALTNPDGTFKPIDAMQEIFAAKGVTPEKQIITYCVRGGLSTYLWFALTQLLDYPNVREYDRSWAEWGNLPNTPIVKGGQPFDNK
jgi:thiosulfate/3-mercaptopyruvate sulfurtransferase